MAEEAGRVKLPPKIAVVAPSGRGKSMSFRNFGTELGLINIEYKELPFKDNFKYHALCQSWNQAYAKIIEYAQNPDIQVIGFDSFSMYLDSLMMEARKTKKGFDVFNFYNENIANLLNTIKRCPKPVIVLAHPEWVQDEGGLKERRIAVKGKEFEGAVEKHFSTVVYADIEINPLNPKDRKYKFILNSDGTNSAKCPPYYFGEEINEIPNDCKYLLDTILSK